jgi:hypothetical protein
MPAFGLGEPFSSVARLGLGPLYAPQLHYAAVVVSHRNPPTRRLSTSLFLLLSRDKVTNVYVAHFVGLLA